MLKRIIAMAAAVGMLFGSTAAGSGGEPVRQVTSKLKAHEEYGPIRPKEVKHDTIGNEKDVEQPESGLPGSDNGAGAGGVLANIGAIDTGGDGEPEQPAGGAEPAFAEDSGSAGEDGGGIENDQNNIQPTEDNSTAAGDDYTEHSDQESVEEEIAETAAEGMEYLGDWTISFYCPCSFCCGQWAGGATASGVMPSAWWTAATGDLPFGTIVYVDGLGTFEVQDRGTGYGWLDVFVGDHGEALANGLQYRSVYIVE